jgi:hypothetical protein
MSEETPNPIDPRVLLAQDRTGLAMFRTGLSHWLTRRRLRRRGLPGLSHWPLSITVAMLFTVICLAGLWVLFER